MYEIADFMRFGWTDPLDWAVGKQLCMARCGLVASFSALRSSGVFRRQRFHRTDRMATTWSWNHRFIDVYWVYKEALKRISNATCASGWQMIANRMCKMQPMIVWSYVQNATCVTSTFVILRPFALWFCFFDVNDFWKLNVILPCPDLFISTKRTGTRAFEYVWVCAESVAKFSCQILEIHRIYFYSL